VIKNKPQTIFKFKDITVFIIVFVFLFTVFFSKSILIKTIKEEKEISPQAVFYIEKINRFLHDKDLNKILLNAYIKNGEFKKALETVAKLPENFETSIYKTELYKKIYFKTKNETYLKKARSSLKTALKHAQKETEFKQIYLQASNLDFKNITFQALSHLKEYRAEYAETAVSLKKYDTALKEFLKLYKNTEEKKYLIKALQTALYAKNKKAVSLLLSQQTQLSQKEKNLFLEAAIWIKQKKSIKKFLTDKTPYRLKTQALLALKDYKALYSAAQKHNDTKLMAQAALWAKNYRQAQKIYLKLYKKNKKYAKTLYALAVANHDYTLMEKTLKEEIKKGNLKKINELVTVFTNNFHLHSGAVFFEKMYNEYKNPKLLKAAFSLYETQGDIRGMIKTASKLGNDISPYIAIKTARIYLGKRQIKNSYDILQKALVKHPRDLNVLKNLYDIETYLNVDSEKTLKTIIKLEPSTYYVVKLSDLYISKNRLKKAWELLNRYKYDNSFYELQKLSTAFKMKNYDYVLKYAKTAPEYVKEENYFWYLYIQSAKKTNLKLKNIYTASLKYTDILTNEFYWYLIDRKDKDIKKYVSQIKNKKILYSAYLTLHEYKKAYDILTAYLNDKSAEFLTQSYYLLDKIDPYSEKIKFFIYKKLKNTLDLNKKTDQNVFDVYFSLALKYAHIAEINKLLNYAKKHYANYQEYTVLYNVHFGNYEKIEYMEKK
jgi:hypothetical protein